MWLKLSDDFGDDAARVRLSDSAFRTHVEGLLWAMRRENGGAIDARDVRRFAESPDADTAVRELVDVGFWQALPDGGWLIRHGMEHQPEVDVIHARRVNAADRQRRKRRKAAGLDDDASRRDSPRDSPRDDSRDEMRDDPRDPGRDGSGRDGTGTSTDKPSNDKESERMTAEPPGWELPALSAAGAE